MRACVVDLTILPSDSSGEGEADRGVGEDDDDLMLLEEFPAHLANRSSRTRTRHTRRASASSTSSLRIRNALNININVTTTTTTTILPPVVVTLENVRAACQEAIQPQPQPQQQPLPSVGRGGGGGGGGESSSQRSSQGSIVFDEDDCCILEEDPSSKFEIASGNGNGNASSGALAAGNQSSDHASDSEDLVMTREVGHVACRDYPHARHQCVQFPFKTSPHSNFCTHCHCYVCDAPAPCPNWGDGSNLSDHCHASDKHGEAWKKLRESMKNRGSDCVEVTPPPQQQAATTPERVTAIGSILSLPECLRSGHRHHQRGEVEHCASNLVRGVALHNPVWGNPDPGQQAEADSSQIQFGSGSGSQTNTETSSDTGFPLDLLDVDLDVDLDDEDFFNFQFEPTPQPRHQPLSQDHLGVMNPIRPHHQSLHRMCTTRAAAEGKLSHRLSSRYSALRIRYGPYEGSDGIAGGSSSRRSLYRNDAELAISAGDSHSSVVQNPLPHNQGQGQGSGVIRQQSSGCFDQNYNHPHSSSSVRQLSLCTEPIHSTTAPLQHTEPFSFPPPPLVSRGALPVFQPLGNGSFPHAQPPSPPAPTSCSIPTRAIFQSFPHALPPTLHAPSSFPTPPAPSTFPIPSIFQTRTNLRVVGEDFIRTPTLAPLPPVSSRFSFNIPHIREPPIEPPSRPPFELPHSLPALDMEEFFSEFPNDLSGDVPVGQPPPSRPSVGPGPSQSPFFSPVNLEGNPHMEGPHGEVGNRSGTPGGEPTDFQFPQVIFSDDVEVSRGGSNAVGVGLDTGRAQGAAATRTNLDENGILDGPRHLHVNEFGFGLVGGAQGEAAQILMELGQHEFRSDSGVEKAGSGHGLGLDEMRGDPSFDLNLGTDAEGENAKVEEGPNPKSPPVRPSPPQLATFLDVDDFLMWD